MSNAELSVQASPAGGAEPGTVSLGGRAVLSAQLIFLAVYLIGSFGVLLAAALHHGDLGALFDPRLERLGDPKDSLPPVGPDSLWNPLVWVFGIARLVAFFVYPLAVVTLLLGAVALIRTRRRDPAAFRLLIATTVVWLALAALSLTPYGTHLHGWLLD